MVDVGDWFFSASLTCTFCSFQGCHSRGKTAPTLPVHRDDRLQVNRPVSYIGKNSDLARFWRKQVEYQGLLLPMGLEG